jgi:phosphopantothenoylcysteine decarboxylase
MSEKKVCSVLALGVTGSIAAYKAADLTSKLRQSGIAVQVLMTGNAQKLVCAQTFFTLSQMPVIVDLWEIPDWRPGHIELSARCKVLLIAPATANILAKMAHGIADDALSTFYLSHSGPTLVAPAMNPRMWNHAATQENCRVLRERGVVFIGPDSGNVACGPGGRGRMASVQEIFAKAQEYFASSPKQV